MNDIFSEIYGLHYRAMKKILLEAAAGKLDARRLRMVAEDVLEDPAVAAEFLERLPEFRMLGKSAGNFYAAIDNLEELPLTILEKR